MAQGLQPEVVMWLAFRTGKSFLAAHEIASGLDRKTALIFTTYNQYRCWLLIQNKCLNYFSYIIRGQTHDTAFLYSFLVFTFFDYIIIITFNYDMYMLLSYANEHCQRAGGEEKNRHAVLQLCSSKTSAITAVVLRRPNLMPLYSDVRTETWERRNTWKHRNGPGEQEHVNMFARERLSI